MYLKNDVIFTKGKVNSTLVDKKSGKVFHLNKEATDFIEKNIQIGFKETGSKEELEFIGFLKKEELLSENRKLACLREARKITTNNNSNRKLFAWIEITNKCNLRCLHCYNESSIYKETTLSLEQFCNVIDKLYDYGIRKIQLIGGEPIIIGETLLKEMLQYSFDKFETVEVFTNGTLLNEELVKFLKDYRVKVALSVYSYSEDVHDYVTTVSGSHKKTIESIELLKKYSVPYRIANVLMKGVEIGRCNTELYKLNPEKDILRLAGRGNVHLLTKELLEKKLITEENFTYPISQAFIERITQGHNCFATKIYIGVDGIVYPCVMERRFNYGSIFKETLEELLINTDYVKKDEVDECCECEYRYICFDCRPDSISSDIYAKPWYCTYKPKEGKWIDKEQFIEEFFMLINREET